MRWIHINHGKDENRPAWQHRKIVAYTDRDTRDRGFEASLSYNLFGRHGFGFGFQLGINGMESDVGLDVYLGRLLSVWIRVRSPWTRWLRLDPEKHGYQARHFGIRLFLYRGSWLRIDCFSKDGEWSSSDPWWYEVKFGATQFWGRSRHETEELEGGLCQVPMPEGNYAATWKRVRTTYSHVRFPGTLKDRIHPRVQTWVDLDIPGCIPNWGKGENSWDSGMDGVCGVSGRTLEEAIDNATSAALRNRKRYHGPHNLPHPMNITEAEEWALEETQ